MTPGEAKDTLSIQRTRSAVIWSHLLGEPLQTVYTFIPFLLYRDLQATVFMVGVLMTLKPMVSIFSLYWSHSITKRGDRLLSNVILTGILGRLPFLFFPFMNSPWLIIASAAFYMMMYRGEGPAWMEVLRRNLPESERGTIFSYGSALAYGEGVLLALAIGVVMDQQVMAWRWIFPITAVVGMIGVCFKSRIPYEPLPYEPEEAERLSWREWLVHPWREAWELLQRRPDYGHFQKGFMICGTGLMIIQPALPLFFVDVLGITYMDLAIAISVCKGLGFTLTCPLWARWMDRTSIYRVSSWVCGFVALFPLFIFFAQTNIAWLYVAYFFYGIGQAGSHLCWNLSGPLFARGENSAMYSSVNVVTVGARGIVVPLVGSILCVQLGALFPFGLSFILCTVAGRFFVSGVKEELVHG